MEILFDNALANLYGPYFLLIYGFFIFFTTVILGYYRSTMDRSETLPVPSIPSVLDPYEIAYLRGGVNELARAVTFGLTQKGVLRLNGSGRTATIEPAFTDRPVPLAPIERTAQLWFSGNRKPHELFNGRGLTNELSGYAAEYQRRLELQSLLVRKDSWWRPATQIAALLVIGLGVYKLIAAVMHGHRNVAFLVIMLIAGLAAVAIVANAPRVSRRGRTYLDRIKTAFGTLPQTQPVPEDAARSLTMASVDPMLLTVGVFGTSVLAGSMYENYQRTFPRSDAGGFASSSCSGGCGGSISDGGSSDGGGGSSCGGGGGCGGGGCGGCGG